MSQKNPIRAILLESVFNPKDKGPIQIIASINDWKYLSMRARELILEAEQMQDTEQAYHLMTQAIALLALAKKNRKA